MKKPKRHAPRHEALNEETMDFTDLTVEESEDSGPEEWAEEEVLIMPEDPDQAKEQRERDLFSPDWQEQLPKKQKRSKRKHQNHVLAYVLLVLALLLTSLLGILYLSHDKPAASNALEELRAKEQQQLDDYTTFINEQAKPESWDQGAFDQIKSQALAAYDMSRLDQIDLALGGDENAIAALEGVETASEQPNLESWKALFTSPQNIPAEVMNLLSRSDPAYVQFVIDYPAHAQQPVVESPLTVSLDTIPDLKTYDPLWGYMPYGNSVFADTGAAPTAISEVFSYLLKDPTLTPSAIGTWAQSYGYDVTPVYENGDSIFVGAALTWGVNLNPIMPYQTLISDAISYGQPVILGLGSIEAPSFVVLTGLDENGNWIVQYPASSQAPAAVAPEELIDQVFAAYAFY